MSADFKSLFAVLRESAAAPLISPLIAEPLPPPEPVLEVEDPQPTEDRLDSTRAAERFESSLQRLLDEIALEVVGREMLLAPIDVERIVTRLKARYGFQTGIATSKNGDIRIVCDGNEIDASLGRRLRAATERARL
jgi:hypothetical protein